MKPTEQLGHIVMLVVLSVSYVVGLFDKQLAFSTLVGSCIVFVPLAVVLFTYKDKNNDKSRN